MLVRWLGATQKKATTRLNSIGPPIKLNCVDIAPCRTSLSRFSGKLTLFREQLANQPKFTLQQGLPNLHAKWRHLMPRVTQPSPPWLGPEPSQEFLRCSHISAFKMAVLLLSLLFLLVFANLHVGPRGFATLTHAHIIPRHDVRPRFATASAEPSASCQASYQLHSLRRCIHDS